MFYFVISLFFPNTNYKKLGGLIFKIEELEDKPLSSYSCHKGYEKLRVKAKDSYHETCINSKYSLPNKNDFKCTNLDSGGTVNSSIIEKEYNNMPCLYCSSSNNQTTFIKEKRANLLPCNTNYVMQGIDATTEGYAYVTCKRTKEVYITVENPKCPMGYELKLKGKKMLLELGLNLASDFKTYTCSWIKKATSISLNKTAITLNVGETTNLKATINPSNASDKTVSMKSSNTNIAIASKTGNNIRTVTAKKPGTATITAKTSNGKKAEVKITVLEVKFNPDNIILDVNQHKKIKINLKYIDFDKIEWSVPAPNTNIAEIVVDKKNKTITVIGKNYGSGTIRAKIKLENGTYKIIGTAFLTVKKS